MNESITVTREQVEEVLKGWLLPNGLTDFQAYLEGTKDCEDLVKSFTTALFNNVKVEEIPRRHDPAQYDRLVEAFEGVMAEREEMRRVITAIAIRHHRRGDADYKGILDKYMRQTDVLRDTHVKVGEEGEVADGK